MIVGYNGLPGSGKTLGMVYEACKYLKRGFPVYSNVPIVDHVYKSGNRSIMVTDPLKTIREVSNALILIDEASIVLPSYFWSRMPWDLLMKFAQVRKYGCDIYYTSQGWGHTVKRLRDLTNYSVRSTNHKYWFSYQWFDPEFHQVKVPRKFQHEYIVKTTHIFPWNLKKVFASYSTEWLVQTPHNKDFSKELSEGIQWND